MDYKTFAWEHRTPEHSAYKANMLLLRRMFLIVNFLEPDRLKVCDLLAMNETELIELIKTKYDE